ncbi:nitroreductase family protein [Phytohabitans houttuyneae]|uniref:Nitroreductase domain-containing protein n=1 Tax=Phytohabitans houttuyneae TaxID=1076126 RepID=A0A6V8KJX1_9ACTN|nr:nitroreductase family protein [Phytohabitans houttuyneae]GFJ84164.1 hypothetical protein Phou_083440 [Phytohabitans houttuyneae]
MTFRLTRDEIAALCSAGVLAPSGGNAQPWRVTVAGDRIAVDIDPSRGSFLDVGGYASRFAAGCFTENVVITARERGLDHEVAVGEGVVTITFTGRRDPQPEPLAALLGERVTNRDLHQGLPLDDAVVGRLAATADPSVAVHAFGGAKDAHVAALGLADAIRMRHRVMFDDMIREICWTEREAVDRSEGLQIDTLGLPRRPARCCACCAACPGPASRCPAPGSATPPATSSGAARTSAACTRPPGPPRTRWSPPAGPSSGCGWRPPGPAWRCSRGR